MASVGPTDQAHPEVLRHSRKTADSRQLMIPQTLAPRDNTKSSDLSVVEEANHQGAVRDCESTANLCR